MERNGKILKFTLKTQCELNQLSNGDHWQVNEQTAVNISVPRNEENNLTR
jgi:hypothetical protein